MELSELVVFNGKLLTFDDRTGLVYVIEKDNTYPWLLLMDGDGKTSKGFKSEWATVKDQVLYVGSMGKEWTTSSGDFENNNPMFVKAITVHGEVCEFIKNILKDDIESLSFRFITLTGRITLKHCEVPLVSNGLAT